MVQVMIDSRFEMWLGWGESLYFFHNDAYAPTLGQKGAWALGAPTEKVWSEIWTGISPRISSVLQNGKATWDEKLLLFLERNGYPEETYHTFSYSPIPNDEGGIGGLLCTVTEVTEEVIAKRRMTFLRELGTELAKHNTEKELGNALANFLSSHAHDLPFALLYAFSPDKKRAHIISAMGVDSTSVHASPTLNLEDPNIVWPATAFLSTDTFSPQLVELSHPDFSRFGKGPWDQLPRFATVVAVSQRGQKDAAGFMVAGLNPHRPLDESYRGFFELLTGQLAGAWSNVRAYEDAQQRAQALAELNQAKTLFFNNVSHELRTPLTLMLGPLEEIVNAPATADQVAHLATVAHRNGLRLLRLVNTLLDFSRIEASRMTPEYTAVDLAQLTLDLGSTFRSLIEKAGLHFVVDCPPLERPVRMDTTFWEKIILNLLSNAFKFTLSGSIRLSLKATENAITLEVSDTGIGIPAEALPRLFERFYRVEGNRGRSQEGTGIGLTLVKDLVHLLDGEIHVESTVGTGTRFVIRLPSAYTDAPPASLPPGELQNPAAASSRAVQEEAAQWAPATSETGPSSFVSTEKDHHRAPRTHRQRILLVDDNADMRDYVSRLLAERYEVIFASDGQSALDLLPQARPDLILSDVMMPRVDGFTLVKSIRADATWNAVPIILLSARAGEEARVDGIERGADDYLVKPFSARELLARVNTHLELARFRQETSARLHQASQRFQQAVEAASIGTWRWDISQNLVYADPAFYRIITYPYPGPVGVSPDGMLARIHPDDLPRVRNALTATILNQMASFDEDYRILQSNGAVRWVTSRGMMQPEPLQDELAMFGVVIDITDRKEAEIERSKLLVEEQRARQEAETLRETALSLATDLDLRTTVQKATDAATQLSGAKFGAFFYNVINERQEAFMLYTLSGADRKAFERFGLPRNTAVFAPTFKGEGVIRLDDVTKDPRYGKNTPHSGLPKGHLPVRSYLAVPVISRKGEVIGGMLFGHPEPAQFDARSERLVMGIAAQASTAIDNAKLYQRMQSAMERLNFSLAALHLGDWTWDAATDIVTLSERTADIFGLESTQPLTREDMRRVLHPDERDRAREIAADAVRRKADYDIEYRVQHPKRGLRWVTTRGRPLFDQDGTLTSMMGVAQDITDRKQAELHLRTQKEVLEQVVNSVPLTEILESLTRWVEQFAERSMVVTVLLVDPDGHHLSFAAGNRCPPVLSHALKTFTAVNSAPDQDSAVHAAHPVVSNLRHDDAWKDLRTFAAENALHIAWSNPIASARGAILGFLVAYYREPVLPNRQEREIVDIAVRTAAIAIERSRSERALRESQERLQMYAETLEQTVNERTAKLRETIGELEAFSYSVSHDMRAPLRSMQGYAELLLSSHSDQLPEEGTHYLRRISKNAERLELLVRDVLAYSKVAKEEIVLTPIDLEAFLPSLVAQLSDLQRTRAEVHLQHPLPVVMGHEAYLSQIFSNLIGNAIKFTRPDVTPRIDISTERRDDEITLRVRDNGIGIDPQHFQRIFEIFGRVHPDRMYEGTGIGLSIVKKAVHRMGGSIGIDSTLGHGSSFWFTLKVA